jgi:hypothetical protein
LAARGAGRAKNRSRCLTFLPYRSQLGWRAIVDIPTQQAIIERLREISWSVNPKIWLGVRILCHNPEVRPGELIKVCEQDVLVEHGIIMVKWPKEGTLKGKHAHLWDDEIEVIQSSVPALPTVPFFRHRSGLSGVQPGDPFGPTVLNKWVGRACNDLGVPRIGLYALVKHSTLTALSTQLTPEQIRRGGSKHASKALERYMLPEVGETRLVQSAIKNLQKVVPIGAGKGATKVQPENGPFKNRK